MSETVHYKGKAVLISQGEQAEIDAKIILAEKGKERDSYYSTNIEYLVGDYYQEYFYDKKTKGLYNIEYEEHELDQEIIRAEEKEDGSIEFELRYYNGGAGFDECLQEAFNKL